MNNKRREIIERAARHMLPRVLEVTKQPEDLKLAFYEEDSTILSRVNCAEKTIYINCKALGDALTKQGINIILEREHEAFAAWLISREIYFYKLGEDHETDTRKLGPANARALRQGRIDRERK